MFAFTWCFMGSCQRYPILRRGVLPWLAAYNEALRRHCQAPGGVRCRPREWLVDACQRLRCSDGCSATPLGSCVGVRCHLLLLDPMRHYDAVSFQFPRWLEGGWTCLLSDTQCRISASANATHLPPLSSGRRPFELQTAGRRSGKDERGKAESPRHLQKRARRPHIHPAGDAHAEDQRHHDPYPSRSPTRSSRASASAAVPPWRGSIAGALLVAAKATAHRITIAMDA